MFYDCVVDCAAEWMVGRVASRSTGGMASIAAGRVAKSGW